MTKEIYYIYRKYEKQCKGILGQKEKWSSLSLLSMYRKRQEEETK